MPVTDDEFVWLPVTFFGPASVWELAREPFSICHCRASDEVSTESGSDRVSINLTLKMPGCDPVATALGTDFIATNDK